jgi:hypothetical protein
MCLYIGKSLPLVAKKDITVYKYVNESDGNYKTPYQDTPVTLNKTLVANRVNYLCKELYNGKHSISEGAIHACLSTKSGKMGYVALKAVIKKGTTFYVQDDFKEIAAKELYITDEVVTVKVTTPDFNCILEDYLSDVMNDKSFANKDGVKVGYYALSDKTFVSPLSEFDHSKAIGVIAFFDKDDEPVIVSLDEEHLPWLTEYYMKNKVQSDINYDDTVDDFDGRKHTIDIVNSEDYDPEKFKAVAYCSEYKTNGTEKGDWYLGATGEITKVAQNMGIINAAIQYTGVGEPLKFEWMWTSSERTWNGDSCAWDCYLNVGDCNYYYGGRYYDYCVRPLSAFINEAKA